MLFHWFAIPYIRHRPVTTLCQEVFNNVEPPRCDAERENPSRRRRRTLCEQIIINVAEDEESADHSNGAAADERPSDSCRPETLLSAPN